MSAGDLRRRAPITIDDWAVSQMPEFQRTMTPHLDFTRRTGAAAPHQYYASDVTQNAFAGWLAARRGLVEVGVVGQRAQWPECELNAAGRELKRGTPVYAIQRQIMGLGVPE